MALVKKPEMTDKKRAANRRNRNLSRGPVTAQGKERIAGAQLRHGLYAKAQEVALRTLGEDPTDFGELLEGLRQEFPSAGGLHEALLIRLARVLWLMDRADRSQEGEALRRAQAAESGRENRLHARMMRLKMTAESLRSLARSVAARHYVTTREDLEVMKKLHQEGVTTEMGEIALALFYQLQEPGTDEDGVSEDDKRRRVVNSIRSIFGMRQIEEPVEMLTPAGERLVVRPEGWVDPGEPPEGEEDEDSEHDERYPRITAEDWRVRERARKLLRNILTRQVEVCETQRKALLKESLAGPSPYELAAEIAPSHAEALLVRRTQDADMREVRRLTNLLLKIERRERPVEDFEDSKVGNIDHDVIENKEG